MVVTVWFRDSSSLGPKILGKYLHQCSNKDYYKVMHSDVYVIELIRWWDRAFGGYFVASQIP